ncbi:MAG: alpha/beta fold hydrolase [Acidimicrobiia bacterium]|nr:alpha/beta fold hydrolase [Acidimicrobiia bacterium]
MGDDGPLALLHHANGFCAATWGVVAERLRPHWRVIAIDARGHGNSSRPQGNAAYQWRELTRDWLAVTRWALHSAKRSAVDLVVGNSLGGAVALLAAAERPDWYRRLVLLDPVALPRRLFGGHGGDSLRRSRWRRRRASAARSGPPGQRLGMPGATSRCSRTGIPVPSSRICRTACGTGRMAGSSSPVPARSKPQSSSTPAGWT